ncbi:MAG: NCS2 family permease [Coleofasciculus chthonoplastes F3-SA18-01]|uniref:NCS2 family permease n=1 Tax=Coleofasciculus chthonoplastes TaxID=64178 RepID=UPI0032FCC583
MSHHDPNQEHSHANQSGQPATQPGVLAKFFKFDRYHTTIRIELLAGFTTFMTMAYILVVNPGILSDAIFLEASGDLFNELVIATALSAAIATLVMGLWANYPLALAPGMGLNAFFTYSVVLGLGIDWRIALSAILIEGLIFIALTLSNVRYLIVKAIPDCLKRATAAGIGLFIAYIGLSGAGIIVADAVTKTKLGDLSQPSTLIAIAGILITSAFVARRLTGALLWGILATAVLAWILGVSPLPEGIIGVPELPVDLVGSAIAGLGRINQVNGWDFLAVVFVFLFVDLFDTVGTLTGVGMQAGYIDEQGELPRANQALMADAVGTTVGAVLGTSTVTTYIESAAGIAEGGRTGFTAVVVAILFSGSIFFIPLLSGIPAFATTPALVIVGVLMAGNLRGIHWDDPAESIPSFLTILMMPLTYSIAEGLAIGLITYPLIKGFQGKGHEVAIAVWVLAGIFVLRFIVMAMNSGG